MIADPPAATMRRDIASAYAASGARIGSWAIVSALVYRFCGHGEFAMLALVRGTIGLLNYAALGIAPALIHRTAVEVRAAAPLKVLPADAVLSYRSSPRSSVIQIIYSNALFITSIVAMIGMPLVGLYAYAFEHLYQVPQRLESGMPPIVGLMGIGTLLRLLSDPSGAILQVRSRIALDNMLVASCDALWVAMTAMLIAGAASRVELEVVAGFYAISGGLLLVMRRVAASHAVGVFWPARRDFRPDIARPLLAYGSVITLAQLADYLYAPTDYILIDRLLGPWQIAIYAPMVQIDAALLLLVTGLSSVLLPRAALAHAAGSHSTVRAYYLRGTFASLGLLSVASIAVWIFSPWLFRLWLGDPMPGTRGILALVLVHTVIGGSSAVGRSILLAVGKVKPFTIAVLIAGLTNVVCSFAFVRFLHWGLKGIVLGTIVAVAARCAIWMPWYILRTLREDSALPAIESQTVA